MTQAKSSARKVPVSGIEKAYSPSVPLYHQIYLVLREKIRGGDIGADSNGRVGVKTEWDY